MGSIKSDTKTYNEREKTEGKSERSFPLMKVYIILALISISVIVFIMTFSSTPTDFQTIEPELDKEEITIGLISDIHIPTRADKIPEKVFQTFKDVDFIIHSGDFDGPSVADELEEIVPLYAVQGNMDSDEIRLRYPTMLIIKIFDHRIGVYHGSLFPWELSKIAEKHDLDVLISGHTHRSGIKRDDTIFVNPGSPTNPIFSKRSIGLLRITRESIEPEIVYI